MALCQGTYGSGARKGQQCGASAKDGGFCGKHQSQRGDDVKTVKTVKEEGGSEHTTVAVQVISICKGVYGSGSRKGQRCEAGAKVGGFCGKHQSQGELASTLGSKSAAEEKVVVDRKEVKEVKDTRSGFERNTSVCLAFYTSGARKGQQCAAIPMFDGYCGRHKAQKASSVALDDADYKPESEPENDDDSVDEDDEQYFDTSSSLALETEEHMLPCLPAPLKSDVIWADGRALRRRTKEINATLQAALEKLGVNAKMPLHPHQLEGIRWMLQKELVDENNRIPLRNRGGIIADDMGLGKTAQLLALILATYTQPTKSCDSSTIAFSTSTLIVCDKGLSCKLGPLRDVCWRRIILDEASRVKNDEAQRTINVRGLRAWNRWCCTATPVENSMKDLKSHFTFLRSEHAENRLFTTDSKDWTENQQAILRTTILRRSKVAICADTERTEGSLTLPYLWEHTVIHALSDDEKAEITRARDAEANAMVKALRERQVTQGPKYNSASVQSSHLEALMTLLANLRSLTSTKYVFTRQRAPNVPPLEETLILDTAASKIVIFSLHIPDLELIAEQLESLQLQQTEADRPYYTYSFLTGEMSTAERDASLQSFLGTNPAKHRETHILLLTLHVGSTGLNLQKANVVILYGGWYNPAIEQQAIGRVHRIGSKFADVYAFKIRTSEGHSRVMDREREIKSSKSEIASAVMEVVEGVRV
ncbi:hypothetical protein HK097_002503, partial [Rhizophlyctis rosea]